jgi:hypothetical protein
MHFSTGHCLSQKYKAADLLRFIPNARMIGASEITVTKGNLPPPTQMYILDPLR